MNRGAEGCRSSALFYCPVGAQTTLINLKSRLEKYSISIFGGMILFFGFSVISLITNSTLKEKEKSDQETIRTLQVQRSQLASMLDVKDVFVGRRIPKFSLKKIAKISTKSIFLEGGGKRQFSVILFLIGQCPTCFEDEMPLWNKFYEEGNKKGVSLIAVNCSLPKELILEYQRERMVQFPMIDGEDAHKDFFKGFETHQVICFVVDSNLMILKAHTSISKQPELTEDFCKRVFTFVENQ